MALYLGIEMLGLLSLLPLLFLCWTAFFVSLGIASDFTRSSVPVCTGGFNRGSRLLHILTATLTVSRLSVLTTCGHHS